MFSGKPMNRFIRLSMTVLAVLSVLSDIGAMASPPRPGAGLRNIIAWTPNLDRALESISPDQTKLVMRIEGEFSQSRLAMIQVGSLLLAPAGRRFPDGLALKVRSLKRHRTRLLLETSQVTIRDLTAVQDGREIAIRPEDIDQISVEAVDGPDGVNNASALGHREGNAGWDLSTSFLAPAMIDALNEVESSRSKPGNGLWTRVREAAIFSTGIRMAWEHRGVVGSSRLRIEDPKLVFKRDQVSFSGRLAGELALGFRPAQGVSFKHALVKLRLQPIPLGMIGPIPLYVRPRIRILIKARVTGSIGCSGAVSFDAPFVTGTKRTHDGWRNLSQATVTATPSRISTDGVSGDLTGKVFIGAAVDFFINDLAGPTLRAGVFVAPGAVAGALRHPSRRELPPRPLLKLFKVKGGAELSVGGTLGFLDGAQFLVDVVRVELPLYKLKLARLEVEPSTLPAPPGSGVETDQLRLVPVYRQTVLNQPQGEEHLSPFPGDWGLWSPPPDAHGRLPAPEGRERRTYSATIGPFGTEDPIGAGEISVSAGR